MRPVNAMVVLVALLVSLMPFGVLTEQAEAAAACCRIFSNGSVNGNGSFRCNFSSAETRRISLGTYEVDFTPLSTDVRVYAKSATLDTQGTGGATGEIGVADRSGDFSSVFVQIRNFNGTLVDAGFDVCLH